MARAHKSLELGRTAQELFRPRPSVERCRNCIIYNEHQRQKHKALTTVALVGVPGLLIWHFPGLQAAVNILLMAWTT